MTPTHSTRKSFALLAVLGLALAASGCAEEREPINRVQPYALKKSDFVGKKLLDPSDDPEFYLRTTLTDVGYGAYGYMFSSTFAQPVARLKWVVEEDYLLGRLTYERIPGTDGRGTVRPSDGTIAVRFKILKHFDIKRAYNATTGEQLNIIDENTTDRPWYEREHFRVDWSQNLVTDSYDFDLLGFLGVIGGVKYSSHPYYVNDPTHPDAPVFDFSEGYFDVTTKAFAKPEHVSFPRYGIFNMPACFYSAAMLAGGSAPVGECSPLELTIRHSFLKVEDRDYVPVDWDGHRFQAFGAFYTERMGYDRAYGLTDSEHYRLVNRFNIWERSHYYDDPKNMTGAVECYVTPGADPNADVDPKNGTADECEEVTRITGVGGSQCDTFNQKCTLPYRLRETRPNPWFYSSGSNLEYFEPTRDAVIEWDAALRFAAQAAKYAECISTNSGRDVACRDQFPVPFGQQDENQDVLNLVREVEDCRIGRAYQGENCTAVAERVGKSRGYSAGVQAVAKMDNIFALCHSPVEHGDPEICGGPRLPKGMTAETCQQADLDRDQKTMATCHAAKNARLGDLRYHQTTVIQQVQTSSPWGIMSDANDPVTGEKLAASANVWSHATEFATQSFVDMARYAKGELTTEEVTEGTHIMDWISAANASRSGGMLQPMTKSEVESRLAGVAGAASVEEFRELAKSNSHLLSSDQLTRQIMDFQEVRADASAPSAMRPTYEARRTAALDSYVEATLNTPMMQQLAGTGPIDPSLREQLTSPFRGANPQHERDMRQLREIALAERGACMINETPSPISVTGVAEVLERKFGQFNPNDSKATQLERAERMRKFLSHRFHHAVMAHEMGHSVGLRHNFVSSSDAFGYRPQYWQLRTQNGERNRPCTDLNTPAGCVGPRYFDPISEEQSDQLIQMFMHSSVMDYPGDLIQDMVGLGIYDFAAARMFYADLTSVHTDMDYRIGQPRGEMLTRKLDNFGGILGYSYTLDGQPLHYSELNDALDLIRDCRTIEPSIFKPAHWDEERLGAWDPLIDGYIVKVNGTYTRCSQQDVDYIPWTNLKLSSDERLRARTGPVHDDRNRVRVPYGFATDHWADSGNIAVFRHDNGADPYELFDFLITQQEMNHIFDNYRRDRLTFSVRGAAFRTLWRFNAKMRDAAKGLGLMSNVYRDFAKDNGYDYNGLWAALTNSSYRGNAVASTLAFDHFTRQLQRPQPGLHVTNPNETLEFARLLRSNEDAYSNDFWPSRVTVPNGASGRYGNVTFGGKPMENRLADNKGDYSSRYTMNAGAYYDKVFTSYLMTESYDNFISSSRTDFLDTRYRAVSMADLFPEAYRRWLATNLTGDEFLKGIRITIPTDPKEAPPSGLGWTSWTNPDGPETCFVGEQNLRCVSDLDPNDPDIWVLESQVGWEQQKFLIAWTMLYLPENAKQYWINQLRVWEIGLDNDPEIPGNARIEFHDPEGRKYVARTFGKETLFGKEVQKGVAARVLEYANELLDKAYETTPVDIDSDGVTDWYEPVYTADGMPKVKFDPGISFIGDDGRVLRDPPADCNETDNSGCTCEANRYCVELRGYSELPFYMREVMGTYRHGYPGMKGIY